MSKMKYSGVEWIGDIPESWGMNKIKYIADVYTGNSIADTDKGLYEDEVDAYPYISTKNKERTDGYMNGYFLIFF